MTIISGIEIDNITYIENDIKNAIKNNKPIENKLHMIICISNPCQFARRYILAREFIKRIEEDHQDDINLYIVELCYGNQKFQVTKKTNLKHLQLKTDQPVLWAKENMLNLGVKLLPNDWKHVAFCDADIEFDNQNFAKDTLKILNKCRDIIQMHSHCLDLNLDLEPMSIFSSFCHQYSNHQKYSKSGIHFWHPGFNVAMTRQAYEQLGGIYQKSILGAGDHNLFLCLIDNGIKSLSQNVSDGYKQSILEYQERCKKLSLGYTPGIIKHFFHGTKASRQYSERWKILVNHQYDPYTHIIIDHQGLQIPSKDCPKEMLNDIMLYFQTRNEDAFFLEHLQKHNTDNLIKFKFN